MWLPGLSSFSSNCTPPSLCRFFLRPLTCEHWSPPRAQSRVSLSHPLLVSVSATDSNTTCVLTIPASLAGPLSLTPDPYTLLHTDISTWMSQISHAENRIFIFLCISSPQTAPSTAPHVKNLGVIFDYSFSHISCLISQQILLVLPSKHTENLSMSC